MTSEQKKQIGTVLGITLFGFAIWYLAFRGKEKIKIKMPSLKKKPNNSNSGSGSNTNNGSESRSGGNGYKPGGGGGSSTVGGGTKRGAANDFPIYPGSQGEAVKWLQEALNDAGYQAGAQDGSWGPKTTAAYKQAFPHVALGVRNDADWAYLMRRLFPNNYQAYL